MLDQLGELLDVGRDERLAPSHIRDAVFERDQGCRFPGCDAPAHWAVYHHIQPWRLGGKTAVANLMCLCPRHHGIIHRLGWSVELTTDDTATFTTPHGHELVSLPRQPGAAPAGPRR